MKTLRILFAGALAILVVSACKKEEENTEPDDVTPGVVYDEAYYAANASISSSNSFFTVTDDGGLITFNAAGGSVAVDVSCGTDWTVSGEDVDWLDYGVDGTVLTIEAGQNTETSDLSGSFFLKTSESGIEFAVIDVVQTAYDKPEIGVETTSVSFPAVGELTATVTVNSTDEWTAESSDSWLAAENVDGVLSLTAEENASNDVREAEVTLTCTDGVTSASVVVEVSQDGAAYVSLSTESIDSTDGAAGTYEVTVYSNYDWTFEVSGDSWVTVTAEGDVLTVTLEENLTDALREASVTVTAGDGAENVAEAVLSISQDVSDPTAMILVYDITEEYPTIQIPFYIHQSFDCEIDWGDGDTYSIDYSGTAGPEITHTYSEPGEYIVRLKSTKGMFGSTTLSADYCNTLVEIRSWGQLGVSSVAAPFSGMKALKKFPAIPDTAFPNVTSLNLLSGVTGYTQDDIPEDMFDHCTHITSLGSFFQNNTGITALPANLLAKCTQVTALQQTFQGTGITEIPEGFFDNLTSLATASYVFSNCANLTTVPAKLFAGNSAVTTFAYLFQNCTSLKTVPADIFGDKASCTSIANVFDGCSGLTSVPEGLFDGCTAVTSVNYIFRNCTSLTSVPTNIFDNCKKVTSFSYAFYGDSGLTCESPYTELSDGTHVHIYQRYGSGYNEYFPDLTKAPTSTSCFNGAVNLTDYDDIPSGWK